MHSAHRFASKIAAVHLASVEKAHTVQSMIQGGWGDGGLGSESSLKPAIFGQSIITRKLSVIDRYNTVYCTHMHATYQYTAHYTWLIHAFNVPDRFWVGSTLISLKMQGGPLEWVGE